MTILTVPALEEEPWPTLGPLVCQYIEENLVFGPGDLRGQPARIDPEKRALLYRFYEVYPQGARDSNGKSIAGRRRFRRCSWSAQKGSAKTEIAAWVAACELSPEAPVRCDGFDANGRVLWRPVADPYIPMVAYTEEQSEDLAYAALLAILDASPIRQLFDIGLERIMRARGDGKAVALAGAPDSRDGARTTFQHKDETHRWNLPRLRRAHRTMLANLPKRLLADPWELETTTAYSPGEESVAEETAAYAQAVANGEIVDSRLFYFHRQAGDGYDWMDPAQRREALIEAAGPTAAWKDIEGISDQWQDPKADLLYLERVYGNRPVATSSQAFNRAAWSRNTRVHGECPSKLITLGFDGSLVDDTTALVATCVRCGWQWVVDIWQPKKEGGEVSRADVDSVMDETFRSFDVWRMYADPSKWESDLARWAGRYGANRVVSWATTLYRKMAVALRAYSVAIASGEASNDGDQRMAEHIGNSQKRLLNFRDDDDVPLWLITKERQNSPKKIDAAMAGCLSWQARTDAVASGVLNKPARWHGIYVPEGEQVEEDEYGDLVETL